MFLPDYKAGRFHVSYGRIVDGLNMTCDVNISVAQDGAPVFTKDTGQFVGILVRGQPFVLLDAYSRAHANFDSNIDTSGEAQIATPRLIRYDVAQLAAPRSQPPAYVPTRN